MEAIPGFLRLNGVTRVNRHEMISRAKEAILAGGGFITDFHMFSNVSICINFEITVGNIKKLFSSLASTNLQLSRESRELLTSCCDKLEEVGEALKEKDVPGTLQITFVHNEPDLRIEVPPVPG